MANQYKNKVIYNGNVLIDLTGDTAVENKVLAGYSFHKASGEPVEGSCTFDVDSSSVTATQSEVLLGKTFAKNGQVLAGTMPNRAGEGGTISTKAQEVTITEGYHDGSGKVSISATEQGKIIPSNILQGVTILGVVGTLEPASDVQIEANKNVTPSASQQVITPSTGYDALAQVTVLAVPYVETDNVAGGVTVTIL